MSNFKLFKTYGRMEAVNLDRIMWADIIDNEEDKFIVRLNLFENSDYVDYRHSIKFETLEEAEQYLKDFLEIM